MAIAALLSYALAWLDGETLPPDTTDRYVRDTFAELQELPLLAAVLHDHPEERRRIETAILEDLRSSEPKKMEVSRRVVLSLLSEHAQPFLARADDASSASMMRAQSVLMDVLVRRHPRGCKDLTAGSFGKSLEFPEVKDAFYEVSKAESIAYAAGKKSSAGPLLSTEQIFSIATTNLALSDKDQGALANLADASDEDYCIAMTKLLQIDLVPSEHRGAYARTLMQPVRESP